MVQRAYKQVCSSKVGLNPVRCYHEVVGENIMVTRLINFEINILIIDGGVCIDADNDRSHDRTLSPVTDNDPSWPDKRNCHNTLLSFHDQPANQSLLSTLQSLSSQLSGLMLPCFSLSGY